MWEYSVIGIIRIMYDSSGPQNKLDGLALENYTRVYKYYDVS